MVNSSGAVFTMRLKDVLIATGGSWVVDPATGISVLNGGDIGLDLYPIHDELYRPILNGKIFDHYMNREIGAESIGMFHLFMRRTLNEIMPLINQYYASTGITIDPISTMNIQSNNTMNDTQTANQTGTSGSNSNTSGSARSVSSTTPQTELSGDEDYADSAADTNSQNATTGTANSTQNSTTTDAATGSTTSSGYQGSPADLLMRYRDSFINCDMMVIAGIEDCFMGIWDNGDSFTNSSYNEGIFI